MRIVTADQMRELEHRASAEFGVSSISLMEAAAESLAEAVDRVCFADTHILILCGPGNNGGDGLASARLLQQRGYEVSALLAADPAKLQGDALTQYRMLAETEVRLHTSGDRGFNRTLDQIDDFDIVLDCLLGTGAKGAPKGDIRKLVDAANEAMAFVIAADIPTGIDCDTGIAEGSYVSASLTVTFGLPKPFLFQNEGLTAAGEWHVADIGLPDELVVDAGSAFLLDHWWASGTFPMRTLDSNKRSIGVVLTVAGCDSFPGAAALAARGALRAGAGLVTVSSVPFVVEGIRNHLPECPVLKLPDNSGFISEDSVELVAEAAERCDAIAIGPGLGRCPSVREFLRKLWNTVETKWVIDADALFWLSELDSHPKGVAILTPHEGEAARMLGLAPTEVRRNRAGATAKLAERFGQTVLLKGAYTVIASNHCDIALNPTGNPGLATGGTGDVLTGICAALLAAGVPAQAAASLGAFWHGAAADLLSDKNGAEMGFLASEVADALPVAKSRIDAGLLGRTLGDPDDVDEEDELDDLEDS